MRLFAIRGATTITSDTREEITKASTTLIDTIMAKNNLSKTDIVQLFITTTSDITSFYPARAIREHGYDIALFSSLEPDISGGLAKCIRLNLNVWANENFVPQYVYLEGAVSLRKTSK